MQSRTMQWGSMGPTWTDDLKAGGGWGVVCRCWQKPPGETGLGTEMTLMWQKPKEERAGQEAEALHVNWDRKCQVRIRLPCKRWMARYEGKLLGKYEESEFKNSIFQLHGSQSLPSIRESKGTLATTRSARDAWGGKMFSYHIYTSQVRKESRFTTWPSVLTTCKNRHKRKPHFLNVVHSLLLALHFTQTNCLWP